MITLVVQVLVILIVSRACGVVLARLGQPRVIGEMLAGILLGASVLGQFWPGAFAWLFPESSLPTLKTVSLVGLVVFMFVVGLDLKVSALKKRVAAAVWISQLSIVIPFALGIVLALFLHKSHGAPGTGVSSFALFMGIAMSITAFPVLARILKEKGLAETPLGTMALTCAAIDDVTAWCLLAIVIGIVKSGSASTAAIVLIGAVAYVNVMLQFVHPLLAKRLRIAEPDGRFNRGQIALAYGVLIASVFVAEAIGIHALFGAFLAGAVMPETVSFRSGLIERIENISAVVLLPVFFAFTGIRMRIDLLDSAGAWLVCALIVSFAIAGKFVGASLAARFSGMSWRESLAMGSLMNTRGLMELVVLNIGYDLGLLSPAIFSMMVIMALLTTAMAGPMLTLLLPREK